MTPLGLAGLRRWQPLEDAAGNYAAARHLLGQRRDELRAEALAALAAGMSESEVARVAGVARMTIRAWAGKPPR